MAATELELLVAAIEKRLELIPQLNLIDRVSLPTLHPQQLAHRGLTITVGNTTILATYAQTDIVRVSDTVTLTLTYRISGKNQRKSRAAEFRLERSIREQLTDPAWYRYAVAPDGTKAVEVHVGTVTRQILEAWIITSMIFNIQRDESLGGVA